MVKIMASTVNRTDTAYVRAHPFFSRLITGLRRPKQPIPGTEFAGQIQEVGEQVSRFQVGDRVFGLNEFGFGSHAQFMTIDQDQALATIPEGISYKDATPCSEGPYYALNFLNKVDLKKEQRVLVSGGTGAIGVAAVQLLHHEGLEVTATCSPPNLELVSSLGAHRVIDYTREDFTRDGQAYDYVFDTVGKSSFGRCKPLLKSGGIYMSSELGPHWQNLYLPLLTKLVGKKKMRFPIPRDCPGCIQHMRELMAQGSYRSVIDREYPFEQIIEAYQYVETGQKTGSVVINMEH